MHNPAVPNEILVTDLEGMYTEHNFMMGSPVWTSVTLSMSFHAVQKIVEYAIKAGIISLNGNIVYYKNGQKRIKYGGKTQA